MCRYVPIFHYSFFIDHCQCYLSQFRFSYTPSDEEASEVCAKKRRQILSRTDLQANEVINKEFLYAYHFLHDSKMIYLMYKIREAKPPPPPGGQVFKSAGKHFLDALYDCIYSTTSRRQHFRGKKCP
jgi:hypothetical protein